MDRALRLLLCLVVMAGCSSTTGSKTQLNSSDTKRYQTENGSFNGYPGIRVVRASSNSYEPFSAGNIVSDENRIDSKVELLVAQSNIHKQKFPSSSTNKAKISKASLNPTYMLRKGETLLTVAKNLKFSKKIQSRAVVAMWINNMGKFVDGNMNGVYKGMILNLAEIELRVIQIDLRTADRIIHKQNKKWLKYIKEKPSNLEFAKALSETPAKSKFSDKTLTVTKKNVESDSKTLGTVKKVSVAMDENLKRQKWSLVSEISEARIISSYSAKPVVEKPAMDLMRMEKIYEKVLPGDNLFKIADRLGYLGAQKIKAAAVLWVDNKDQFLTENMNLLKPGVELDITNLSIRVSKIDFNTAENILIKHGEKWPQEIARTPSNSKTAIVDPMPVQISSKKIKQASEMVQLRNPQKLAVASLEKKEVVSSVEKVLQGDTLTKIVNRLGYSNANEMKAVVALWSLNKALFIDNNMNGIPAGESLNISALATEMDKLDHMAVMKIVKTQWKEWKRGPSTNDIMTAKAAVTEDANETQLAKAEIKDVKFSKSKKETKKANIKKTTQLAALPKVAEPKIDSSELTKPEPSNDILTKLVVKKSDKKVSDNGTPSEVSQESDKPKLTFESWKNSVKGIINNLKSKILNITTTVSDKIPFIYTNAIDLLEDIELSLLNEGNDKAEVNFN